ncbi:CRISPR-associated Csh2 family protein [Gloeomargarita lithophora Alchichica-D10]|uniref:CRISPR-associated Csh2 family protein n=1 Tax=Gloeomargarita lithophora Alchichica-D10 TaxID=1188229 RepID=A0A1J0ACN9_9CYAN|nr:type I-C CRISPR-associated protein Cas7/Csd2 [Gloeomargarita lithophora]APB33680.1 CRISPR-associated Csh2 family protein [Gloeomargarita lithophora Alchichica-D10]
MTTPIISENKSTTLDAYLDPKKRHDAVLLIDITDGNPNGDPDAGNQPRIDPETRQGLMTDSCIKRKLRNYVQVVGEGEEGLHILIEDGAVLRDRFEPAFDALKITKVKKTSPKREEQLQLSAWLQARYWDLRLFGGVLESELRAGQVWGPVQISIARSIDPILPMTMTITRCASSNLQEGKDQKTMGKKELIPYGLYRAYITYSPHRAPESLTSEDLKLLWTALADCWDMDRSSGRSLNCRGLYVFTHDNKYGNAPAHRLFEHITTRIQRKEGVDAPRQFSDYQVTIDEPNFNGITLKKLVF